MRLSVAMAVACLSLAGMVVANETEAAIRKPINIPSQELGSALQIFAKERGFQIVFVSDEVEGIRTRGASGELTPFEALTQILDGTGMTFRSFGENAVSIVPVASTTPSTQAGESRPAASMEGASVTPSTDPSSQSSEKGAPKSFWQRFRLAQSGLAKSTTSETGATGSDSSVRLEEVVVTAQKREERLQDVPISISVLTGEQLDTSTSTNLADVLNRIPGLVATVPSRGNPWVVIRGVPPSGAGGTVGYYVDSVSFGFSRFNNYPDMNVYDLDRIEVLRGPQGTLYGASSMNGVVRILTKQPNLSAFEAKTRASVSSIEDGGENYRVDAAANLPLIEDRLAIRLIGGYQELGGWIDKPNNDDANAGDIKTLRAKLRAQPTEALTLDAGVWFSRSFIGAQMFGLEDRTLPVTDEEDIASDFDTYSFTAIYDFGGTSITSATSYIDFVMDNSLSLQGVGGAGVSYQAISAEVFSEEITLQSTQDGPWRWSIGAMYRDAKDRNRNVFNGAITGAFGDQSESFAVFGDATRKLLDGRFEATLGLRYFHNKFSTEETFTTRVGPLFSAEGTSDALTPRAVVAWHPSEGATVYASYAQGFRSALAQSPTTLSNPLFAGSGIGSVEDDTLINYEIGAKSTLLEGRLSLESALYYMDWQDVKATLSVPIPDGFVNALVNGPGASGVGVDAALTFRPFAGLEIGGSISWNDLTMDEDVRSGGRLLYRKGDRLGSSPELTAQGLAGYSFPLAGLTGRISTTLTFLSSQNSVLAGDTPIVFESDDLTTVSANFSVDSGDRWSASVFVDNLNDENQIPFNTNGIANWQPRIAPRTVGLQFEFHY
jgi:iron complex outermembrane recepter protein